MPILRGVYCDRTQICILWEFYECMCLILESGKNNLGSTGNTLQGGTARRVHKSPSRGGVEVHAANVAESDTGGAQRAPFLEILSPLLHFFSVESISLMFVLRFCKLSPSFPAAWNCGSRNFATRCIPARNCKGRGFSRLSASLQVHSELKVGKAKAF